MRTPVVTLRLTPLEQEATRRVVQLSTRSGFPYFESDAIHWLIAQGIAYLNSGIEPEPNRPLYFNEPEMRKDVIECWKELVAKYGPDFPSAGVPTANA